MYGAGMMMGATGLFLQSCELCKTCCIVREVFVCEEGPNPDWKLMPLSLDLTSYHFHDGVPAFFSSKC